MHKERMSEVVNQKRMGILAIVQQRNEREKEKEKIVKDDYLSSRRFFRFGRQSHFGTMFCCTHPTRIQVHPS
jgi:hypothetical protein